MKLTDIENRGTGKSQFKTLCPDCSADRKHKDNPCLAVNLEENIYSCHNCGISGHFEDAPYSGKFATKTTRQYAVPPTDTMEKDAERLDGKCIAYFHSRGISETTLGEWKIGYGPSFRKGIGADGIPQYHRAIKFPFFEDGKLVWVKHICPPEWSGKERLIRSFEGGKPVPFGLDRAGKWIVITEGEIDAMSVYEAGISEVWSVPNGSQSLGFLEFPIVVEKLEAAERIFLAGDADKSGMDMREELIRRLCQNPNIGAEKLFLVEWPDDCKDANDVLVKHGPAVLYACITEMAQGVPVDGISEIDEFVGEFLSFYNNGLPKGESTGIETLDQIYRVMPGMVTVITGVTNYGKSELMDEIVRNMIDKSGWKFAFYSPENYPMSLHMMKLAEKWVGKPFDTERFGHMSANEAAEAAQWMQDNIYYINPRNRTFSIKEILERAKILIYRKGIRGLVIDPWNYVRKDFGAMREDQFINAAMQEIGVFTKATGVHVWLTVHPRTLKKDKEGKIEVPTVMELSGGSKFGDNADFVFAVHRDPMKAFQTGIHEVMVHVQKSRYRPAATQGNVKLIWNPFNGRFSGEQDAVLMPQEDKPDDDTIDPF